jgi:hypothetical protein
LEFGVDGYRALYYGRATILCFATLVMMAIEPMLYVRMPQIAPKSQNCKIHQNPKEKGPGEEKSNLVTNSTQKLRS